uniref:Uncharacterized protein n=1 Tax=Leersia perrieri TaxID=77586 RepID=A0A0D9XZB3_9ORYZ
MASWVVDLERSLPNVDVNTAVSEELRPRSSSSMSLGPFHHGDPIVAPMEEHKRRAVARLVRRSGRPLVEFAVASELEGAYHGGLGDEWRGGRFLQVMVTDGCFLLGMMRTELSSMLGSTVATNDFEPDDPVFSRHGAVYMVPYVRLRLNDMAFTIRSTTELYEVGIRFKRSRTDNLHNIRFHRGVLSLPAILVDDTTMHILLNLMAFERLHSGAGSDVTAYVFFMENLVDSWKDVWLLTEKGIIQNSLGSDKEVAKLFNGLTKEIALEHRRTWSMEKTAWNFSC